MPIPTITGYVDGLSSATPCGLPEFSPGIPGFDDRLVLTQPWQMLLTSEFIPTGLSNTAVHPDYTNFVLVEESGVKDIGAGQVQWTKKYAKIPNSYDEWETYPYNFIGYAGTWGGVFSNPGVGSAPTGRNRQQYPVQSRIRHDFFLVDSVNGTINGPGTIALPYDSPGSIPIVVAQKYRLIPTFTSSFWLDIDHLSDHPPFNFATTPDRTTYHGYVINALRYGWQSGVVIYDWNVDLTSGTPIYSTARSGVNPGQIAVQDSTMERWLGNIWLRKSRYILAQ